MIEPQYETVWSGASWRDIPPPTKTPAVRSARPSQAGAKGLHKGGRALVRACLADGAWYARLDVEQRTGLSRKQVQIYLAHGAKTGDLERKEEGPALRAGRPRFLYRRRQTAEQAA